MVNLDIAPALFAVCCSEVEFAYLAQNRFSSRHDLIDLLLSQHGVTLTYQVELFEEAALSCNRPIEIHVRNTYMAAANIDRTA